MSYTLTPSPVQTFLDDEGAPIALGKVYTYEAGPGLIPADTFSDDAGTPHTNPIILPASARVAIYLGERSYKFVVKTALGVTVWTQDNIASVAFSPNAGLVSEIFAFIGDPNSPVTDTTYPAGAGYDKLHAGSAIWAIDSALLQGSYTLESMLKSDGSVTVTLALVNLSDGAPDTPLITVASSSPVGERIRAGGTITFPAGGATKNYGIKAKVSAAGYGFCWAARIVRTV